MERITKYTTRLKEVRAKRQAFQQALQAGADEAGQPGPAAEPDFHDAASEAGSMVSNMSVYTDRTHTGASVMSSSRAPSTVGECWSAWRERCRCCGIWRHGLQNVCTGGAVECAAPAA